MKKDFEKDVDKFCRDLDELMDKYNLRILSADMLGMVMCPTEEFELRAKIHFKLKYMTTKELLRYIV